MTVNQVSGKVVIGLSLIAFGAMLSGYFGPVQQDEGAAAHIFQLSVALLVPSVLGFLATMDHCLSFCRQKRCQDASDHTEKDHISKVPVN
ncbi:MAG: hypothetical protein WA209_09955, partial [Candidatus Acidiferrales bacterium]